MKFLIALDSYFLAAVNTSRKKGKRDFAVEGNSLKSQVGHLERYCQFIQILKPDHI